MTSPAVKGVTIYISDFKRSISDKLNKDFFSEPSQVNHEDGYDIQFLDAPNGGVSCLCPLTRLFSKTDVVLNSGIRDLCPDWSSANPRYQSYNWC